MLKTKVYIPNNNMMLIYKQWAVKNEWHLSRNFLNKKMHFRQNKINNSIIIIVHFSLIIIITLYMYMYLSSIFHILHKNQIYIFHKCLFSKVCEISRIRLQNWINLESLRLYSSHILQKQNTQYPYEVYGIFCMYKAYYNNLIII